MRGRGVFTCTVVFLHLCLLASVLETRRQNVLVVKEKWFRVDKKILPWIKLSAAMVDGYDACVRLRLRVKPLLANKTLRIEFNELAVRHSRALLIQIGRHDHSTVWWKEMFANKTENVKIKTHASNNKHPDVQRELVWELQYDCFIARRLSSVHVAVYDFDQMLIDDSYTVKLLAEVPAYNVTPDIYSKRFVVHMEVGQKVNIRLCDLNKAVCNGTLLHTLDTDVNRTVTLKLPYLVPCLCVQLYFVYGDDARRHTTCPLKDKILPGGGEVLSRSSLQLFGSSVLQWNHLCSSALFEPDVSLCWQHTRNHSQCVSVQNSTLHMSNLRYNVSDVDKHAHTCLKFFLNDNHRVFCPFSSGKVYCITDFQADLSEWDVAVVPGYRRLYVNLSSNIPASFAAQLCVEKGESCVMTERIHTVRMKEGLRDVEMTVPLPFFTSGLCVQVWRSDPALRGRRIICPDYTHRRWGLIVAASLAVLVAVTTLGILTYNLIKRQTSVWHSAERKPVLLVCSSDETSHISAVCALAFGLQEELRMDVRLAQWAHCSTRTSLAQLGPAPWLYSQCQQVQSVGGVVLIAWSPKAQQTYLQWREIESGGKAEKLAPKDKVLLKELRDKQGPRWSSITAPVFNASLISMWAGLQSEQHGQGFGLVCFRGLCGTRYIPKELRGVRKYCLPKDLPNLIHELDVNVHGPESRGPNRSSWCCWPQLFSKGLSFWLSQRLARRLDARLPQTTPKSDRKRLLKLSCKVSREKKLRRKLQKKKKRENCCRNEAPVTTLDCSLDTQKSLLT